MRRVLLLQCTLLLALLPAALAITEHVIDLKGDKAFDAGVRKHAKLFVKFFDPRCPHCQAAKRPYDALAATFGKKESPLQFAEVDASLRANAALVEQYAGGLPTLKLFLGGRYAAEYGGVREEGAMERWLDMKLKADGAPLLTPIGSRAALDEFLKTHAEGPVVLVRGTPEIMDEVTQTAGEMRHGVAPSVRFGLVNDESVLVPQRRPGYRSNSSISPYGVPPYAAAALTGKDFAVNPVFWTPRVLGGDSFGTFAVVSTLPDDGGAVLTPLNAPAVSAVSRPVLYAFGSASAPSTSLADEMRELIGLGARDLVAVYGNDLEFASLCAHLGLPPVPKDKRTMPRETQFVLYRSGNRGADRFVYRKSEFGTKRMWLQRFYEIHGRAPMRLGRPGEVYELGFGNWEPLMDHDGRAVLIHVFDSGCKRCRDERETMEQTAEILKDSFPRIVVASYDVGQGRFPGKAHFKEPENLPFVGVVLPGEQPRRISHFGFAGVAAKMAVSIVDSKSRPGGVVTDGESRVLYIGVFLIGLGIALFVRRCISGSMYSNIARIRQASKSV